MITKQFIENTTTFEESYLVVKQTAKYVYAQVLRSYTKINGEELNYSDIRRDYINRGVIRFTIKQWNKIKGAN